MLYFRVHQFPVPGGEPFAAMLARVNECLAMADVAEAPMRFCFVDHPGSAAGCNAIIAKFSNLARFAPGGGGQTAGLQSGRLSNLGPLWDGGAGCSADGFPHETLAEIAGGIPNQFPVAMAFYVIGPVRWIDGIEPCESSMRMRSAFVPPFSVRAPALTYMTPSVVLQWYSAAGSRLFVTEQTPSGDAKSPLPAGIKALYGAYPGAAASKPMAVPDGNRVTVANAPVSNDIHEIHARHRAAITAEVEKLNLPHVIPGPMEALKLVPQPLGSIRGTIVKAFAPDGWKKATGRIPAGSHEIWKPSPGGRRLQLHFDTGSWSRHVICIMRLVTEAGPMRIIPPASWPPQAQYSAPNPEVFGHILENLRIVVKHLEATWAKEMEEALGPVPPEFKPGNEEL
ncbi:MAG TPA: hypothetical protein VMU16_01710 [Candidatus Binataceae bacterium]|nr:hypothetical protein [Candidatus Binataceae bacterium]